MATSKEVAEWMAAHFQVSARLYQESVVYKIRSQFGPEHVYKNANGNLAISKDVLKHFQTLTEGKVVWERGERAWRVLRPGEVYKGRQKD
ncbi:DUF6953 family protein [Paraburkholderia sp. A3RO-2L]|uniref:DUF6953 family protein n=1 Tax=Paraburkholderia sp. A3RO-2L TaxID=3028376 RepID=UPI003DA92292